MAPDRDRGRALRRDGADVTATATTYTVWQLARMAGCADPDSLDTAGAHFLNHVADLVDDAIRWEREQEGRTLAEAVQDVAEDGRHEIADGSVPIGTYGRWRAFCDLAAWEEDFTEWNHLGTTDMTEQAALALYAIADRLVSALCEDWPTDDHNGDKDR